MLKKVVKFGAIAVLIACSVHSSNGAVVKGAHVKNAHKLAQASKPVL